jgi:hypothetical protein
MSRISTKAKYPVGARWNYEDDQCKATYWLDEIRPLDKYRDHQVWRWSIYNIDGSGHRGDWGTTKRSVQDEVSVKIYGFHVWKWQGKIRFKRTKGGPP